MLLAERFKDLRVKAGLTGTALAAPRYTPSYISQIESGRRRPSSEALTFFAGRLGVSPDFLATGVPEGIDAELRYGLERARDAVESRVGNGHGSDQPPYNPPV